MSERPKTWKSEKEARETHVSPRLRNVTPPSVFPPSGPDLHSVGIRLDYSNAAPLLITALQYLVLLMYKFIAGALPDREKNATLGIYCCIIVLNHSIPHTAPESTWFTS